MREIKFRVYDSYHKKFYDDYASITKNGFVNVMHGIRSGKYFLELCRDSDFIWQQFTGLTDKNGKEIYEGDIVKTDSKHFSHCRVDWCEYTKGTIIWLTSGFYVCQKYIGANELRNYVCGDDDDKDCGLEVIGNIYENPKLLEVSEEADA